MDRHKDELNESLLANAYAWMRKAHGDKMDGELPCMQANRSVPLRLSAGSRILLEQSFHGPEIMP